MFQINLERAGKVDELRETLIRVIRTSTSDVDRRESGRLLLQQDGTLTYRGIDRRVRVRDISLHGAMVDDVLSDIPVQSQVTIKVCGIPVELAAIVDRKDRDATLLRLTLPENAGQALAQRLDAAGHARAA